MTNSDIIAQFIPSVAAALGSPKQVEHAYKDPARKMINKDMVLINGIIIFF